MPGRTVDPSESESDAAPPRGGDTESASRGPSQGEHDSLDQVKSMDKTIKLLQQQLQATRSDVGNVGRQESAEP